MNSADAQLQAVPVAVLDMSFFGYKVLIPDYLSKNIIVPVSKINSPHGTSVVQVMIKSVAQLEVSFLEIDYLGHIEFGDVKLLRFHLQRIYKKGIRLVNISMEIKTAEQIVVLNEYIDKGLVIVLSAGNSAERFGIEIADIYKKFQGVIASSMDDNFQRSKFSRYCHGCIMVPGGEKQYSTVYLDHRQFDKRLGEPEHQDLINGNVQKRSHFFGRTSSAAPVVAAAIGLALSINPSLSISKIKDLLLQTSSRNEVQEQFMNVDRFIGEILKLL